MLTFVTFCPNPANFFQQRKWVSDFVQRPGVWMDFSMVPPSKRATNVTSRQAMQMSVVSKFSGFENLYPQMLFFSTGDPSGGCPALWWNPSIRRGHFSPPEIDQRGVQYSWAKSASSKKCDTYNLNFVLDSIVQSGVPSLPPASLRAT